jgi:MFS family permease
MLSIAFGGLLGGFVGAYHLGATFLITAVMMVLGTVFLLGLKEPPLESDPHTGLKLTYRQTLQVAFGTIRQKVRLRYALVYSSLLYLMPASIRMTFFQPYAIAIGLPIASLGVITMGFRAFQVLGSMVAGKTIQHVGEWSLFRFFPVPIFIGLLAIGSLQSWVGITIFAASGFFTAAVTPTIENLINRQTPGTVRATILSIDSLFFRLLTAVLAPLVGLTADSYGLPNAFVGMSLVYGVLMLALLLLWGRQQFRTKTA